MKLTRLLLTLLSVLVIVSMTIGGTALAASTNKSLSTNFTLVNLGDAAANVALDYIKPDGSPWTGSTTTSAVLPADGGQLIVRQYTDSLTPGSGSVVVSSDQVLGALVQIRAMQQGVKPTEGAYTGLDAGDAIWYIPLVARHGSSGTGVANSQIVVQNLGQAPVNANIRLSQPGDASPDLTIPINGLAVGASFYFDAEGRNELGENWWGYAVVEVSGTGSIGVVTNLFFGADSLLSLNAFPNSTKVSKWFVPLLYSRLANSLTSSVVIQNISGTSIAAGELTMTCTKTGGNGAASLNISNSSSIANTATFSLNTFTQTNLFPTNWYGSCTVQAAGNKAIVVMIHDRYTAAGNNNQAGYEAIPGNSTETSMYVPLIAKTLSNGFATTVTIQNLTSEQATLTMVYTPSGGGTPITRTNVTIPANGNIVRNFRLAGTESDGFTTKMPAGWVGTLKVTSNRPIQAMVQNTYTTAPNGDQLQAYLAFTK